MKRCAFCPKLTSSPQANTCGSPECQRKNRRKNEKRYQKKLQGPRLIVIPEIKHCGGCNADLPSSTFGRNRATHDGLQSYCKACRKRFQQRADQQERDKARKAKWYEAHRDEMLLLCKKRYNENREARRAESSAKYAAMTPEQRAERLKQNKANYQARKMKIRRVCPCGRGYYVHPNDRRTYFCSAACRLETRYQICENLLKAAKRIGVRLVA